MSIYLASQSPRRKQLLQQMGIDFDVIPIDVDESLLTEETAEQLVTRLAEAKALAGVSSGYLDRPVLGSDTVVVLDGKVLGKPKNKEDAFSMLKSLSGRTHQVITGIALASERQVLSEAVITDVSFRTLTDTEIEQYWQSKEPQDKAGGYGIQGLAGKFVTAIRGSYFAVVGLPLYETEQLIHAFTETDKKGQA